MKKFAFALLLLAACAREPVVESTTRPADETAATSSTTPPSTTDAPPPPAPPTVNGPKLAFVDEASKDPSFATFRDQLATAVHARDTKAVLALTDPAIRTSFGGDGGHASLKEEHWRALDELLPLGGTFREGMFWAPYVYSAWPESVDSFEYLAIVADDVPLRQSEDAGGPAIATLSRDIVKRAGQPGANPGPWTKVETADGKTGFVESKFVRSPVGYRAGFIKTAAGWRMNALVAGD
jgi:hypothetical protein